MDAILTDQLERIEASLNALVDSIASYNPSISAAETLVRADDDLQTSLQQLHTHQRNEARIQSLRRDISYQDSQIRLGLQQLADVREQLFAVPNSLPADGIRDVQSEEVLDFASRLSRYAVPPNLRANAAGATETGDAALTTAGSGNDGFGWAALVEEEKRWLDPWTGVQFTPWPGEEAIRSSALARVQAGETDMMDMIKPEDGIGEGGGSASDLGQQSQPNQDPSRGQDMGFTKQKVEKAKVFGGLDLYDPEVDD